MELKGSIFDIQNYSINDGPGIRTTVFFKGCPLKCLWCSNPESQISSTQLFYFESLCIHCGRCVEVCPNKAIGFNKDGKIFTDRALCDACGRCTEVCLNEARVLSGSTMDVSEVVDIVKKDSLFYRNSGGGITVSGGEPCYQPEFLKELLNRCQEIGIHTAIDTCGFVSWGVFEAIIEHVDLILFDIKHMDGVKHKQFTGVDNSLILENIKRLSNMDQDVIIRFPLITGYNDSEDNVKRTGEFVRDLGFAGIDVLPYHKLATKKYESIGRDYQLQELESYDEMQLASVKNTLMKCDLEVSVV